MRTVEESGVASVVEKVVANFAMKMMRGFCVLRFAGPRSLGGSSDIRLPLFAQPLPTPLPVDYAVT